MLQVQKSSEAVTETQRQLHDSDEHLVELHHSISASPKTSSSFDRSTLNEFNMDIEEPDETGYFGSGEVVRFENELVVLENKNIFKNPKLKFQLAASMGALFLIGLTDQVVGSLLEYFLAEYHIDRVKISYLFFAQFCGYIPSSIFNNYMMGKYGIHKLFYSSCLIMCVTSTFFFFKAPFFLLPICSVFIGWCNGTFDCCLNYFVGSLDYSNELLGIMHSMYGMGCLITPVFSIYLIQHGMAWNHYYIFLFGTAFVNFLLAYFFFKNETSAKYRYVASLERKNNSEDSEFLGELGLEDQSEPTIRETLANKYIIFYSVALFAYVGSELSVGVWLNNYLFRIQKLAEEKSSVITSTFWLFMTLGRGVMGFFTGRYFQDSEIHAIVIYCFVVAGGCLSFWICEFSVLLQTISICVAAWFVGPLFGTTIIIALKTLPKRYALHGISLIAGFGGTGAAIVPALMGYIAENFGATDGEPADGAGLKYFPEVIFFTFSAAAMLWFVFYMSNKRTFDAKIRLR